MLYVVSPCLVIHKHDSGHVSRALLTLFIYHSLSHLSKRIKAAKFPERLGGQEDVVFFWKDPFWSSNNLDFGIMNL